MGDQTRPLIGIILVLAIGFAIILTLMQPAPAGQWKQVEVYDGDTVFLERSGDNDGVAMRLSGIDTPEIHGRCDSEKAKAQAAKQRLIELTKEGVRVVSDLSKDLYGRYIVSLIDRKGRNIAAILIEEGHGRAYSGVGARQGWC